MVLLVASPLLFTEHGFNLDLTNNLWLGNVQRLDAFHGLFPSYFTNTTGDGIFNPIFAFYGGSMCAILGNLAFVLGGNVVAAQDAMTVAAIIAAYWGLYWLGRQLGLSRWFAQAPSVAFVTSAYYITNLYGRGDWLEFLAVSSLPILAANAPRSAPRSRMESSLAIISWVLCSFFTGSHNITLLWGTAFLCLVALALVIFCGRDSVNLGSLLSLLGVGLMATLTNAWALVPNLLDAGKTASTIGGSIFAVFFDSWSVIFYPFRLVAKVVDDAGPIRTGPVWFIVWSVVGGATVLLQHKRSRELTKPWVAMLVVLAITLSVMMVTPIWFHMPRPFVFIRFPID